MDIALGETDPWGYAVTVGQDRCWRARLFRFNGPYTDDLQNPGFESTATDRVHQRRLADAVRDLHGCIGKAPKPPAPPASPAAGKPKALAQAVKALQGRGLTVEVEDPSEGDSPQPVDRLTTDGVHVVAYASSDEATEAQAKIAGVIKEHGQALALESVVYWYAGTGQPTAVDRKRFKRVLGIVDRALY